MVRTTASLTALCILIFVIFVGLEGCGQDPLTIPCGPDAPCAGGYRCGSGGDCFPPCDEAHPCSQVDDFGRPDPVVCHEGFCYRPAELGDAGPLNDAGDSGKSSAICGEPCKSIPDGWSSMPAVWLGPVKDAPFYSSFHDDKTLPRFIGRADLTADLAECDTCSCGESTGKCTDLPSSIQVRAAICGEAGTSLSFDGPTNWTGSCTNVNAIAAGQKCPAGSSTLCAQSVIVAPLGAPVEESCTPLTDKLPVARARVNGPVWNTAAIGYDVPGCEVGTSCMPSIPDLPKGFRSCIYQRGEQECPATWSGDRHVVYEVTADKLGFIDGRTCSPCSCGAPVGSTCTAHLRTYEDGACSKLISDVPLASLGEQCSNVLPAGKSLGSKEITSLEYLPSVCEPIGGEPIGEVKPDPDQAITFCCFAQDA